MQNPAGPAPQRLPGPPHLKQVKPAMRPIERRRATNASYRTSFETVAAAQGDHPIRRGDGDQGLASVRSRGRPAAGIEGGTEHAQQTDSQENQACWLGDDIEGAVTDIVPPMFVKPPAPGSMSTW